MPIEPLDNSRIRTVHSFAELLGTPFADGVNALCWPRELSGDFGEVVEKLGAREEIMTVEEEQLVDLKVSAAGRAFMDVVEPGLLPRLAIGDFRLEKRAWIDNIGA